jgi:hypothetical protein
MSRNKECFIGFAFGRILKEDFEICCTTSDRIVLLSSVCQKVYKANHDHDRCSRSDWRRQTSTRNRPRYNYLMSPIGCSSGIELAAGFALVNSSATKRVVRIGASEAGNGSANRHSISLRRWNWSIQKRNHSGVNLSCSKALLFMDQSMSKHDDQGRRLKTVFHSPRQGGVLASCNWKREVMRDIMYLVRLLILCQDSGGLCSPSCQGQ